MDFQILRNVDRIGRICLPRDVRRYFHMSGDTPVYVEATPEGILLRPLRIEPQQAKSQRRL